MKRFYKKFSTCVCPPPPRKPIVAVLDVLHNVGANLALLLKQNPLVDELRVYDEIKDTHAIALDLSVIDTRVKVTSFGCCELKDAITGAHIVVSSGGCQNKCGLTQQQLLDQNVDNVRNVAMFLSEFNPTAIFCIARPPIESLVPLVAEEYKKAGTLDPRKIIGITSHISMAANCLIAKVLKTDPSSVHCPLIGGVNSNTIIPVVSQTKPRPVPYSSHIYTTLQDQVAQVEESVIQQGSLWCFSKAVGISRFVTLLLQALKGCKKCADCAFVAQTGHIGEFLPYMTSVVQLGPEGVVSTHMPRINEFEIIRLRSVLPHIYENISLGQSYLNGDFAVDPKFRPKRKADELLKKKLKEYGHQCLTCGSN